MTQTKQKQIIIAAAQKDGESLGAFVFRQGWENPEGVINRSAVGYVNRQPLNDIPFENELQAVYIAAALQAFKARKEAR